MTSKIYKVALAAALVIGATGVAQAANSGVITLQGAISSSTCNMNLSVNGVVSPSGVADLGIYKASEASGTVGTFGNQTNLSLIPDPASCDVSPVGSDAMIIADTSATDASNTDVLVTADSSTTNVGVLFQLASGASVLNKGGVTLTAGTADLDDTTGAVNFTAQPYALQATVNPGVIGGSVAYTVAYL
ncbi:type 1 fimbrial protein [Enterobacteriaceae bacterium 89]|nr:type 1 fimbrial protein [Enterobacteriaceae bacterium 89]